MQANDRIESLYEYIMPRFDEQFKVNDPFR